MARSCSTTLFTAWQHAEPQSDTPAHENDKNKGGCEFGTLFSTTPQGLINEGIYKDIAVALHTPPHRAISLALLAQACGATKDAARTRKGRSSSSSSSSSSQSLAKTEMVI